MDGNANTMCSNAMTVRMRYTPNPLRDAPVGKPVLATIVVLFGGTSSVPAGRVLPGDGDVLPNSCECSRR